MTDTSVKFFESTMSGAPALGNTAGAMIGLLDACLVNGFGSITVDSLIVSGNVATAFVSTGHGISMYGTSGYGPVIAISGATPTALNGEWRAASVDSVTTLTFATSGIADGTATGTISLKRAPAGWAKAHSGTNVAAYSRPAPAATEMLVRVDHATNVTHPGFRLYETMSDVDTGTGGSGTTRYTGMNGPSRPWRLFADDRLFWLFVDYIGSGYWSFVGFGDIDSYVNGDAYGCLLRGITAANTSIYGSAYNLASAYCELARDIAGVASTPSAWYGHARLSTVLGNAAQPWPASADGVIHTCPLECWDSGNHARGRVPGLFGLVHGSPGSYDGTILNAVPGLDGRPLFVQMLSSNTSYGCALSLVGPWR